MKWRQHRIVNWNRISISGVYALQARRQHPSFPGRRSERMRSSVKTNDLPAAVPASAIPHVSLWVRGLALIGALLLGAGAAIAYVNPGMLLSPHEQISEGVRVYAGYLVSRNAALALGLLGAVLFRLRTLLGTMLLLVGAIQIFDACLDAVEGRWTLVPGVTVLGILFLLGATRARPIFDPRP
jgi:hypothetical protein